jgi:hypothetical protein
MADEKLDTTIEKNIKSIEEGGPGRGKPRPYKSYGLMTGINVGRHPLAVPIA